MNLSERFYVFCVLVALVVFASASLRLATAVRKNARQAAEPGAATESQQNGLPSPHDLGSHSTTTPESGAEPVAKPEPESKTQPVPTPAPASRLAGEARDVDVERVKKLMQRKQLSTREALHYRSIQEDSDP